MRIAILSPFYPFRGGIAQFSARLYTELSKNHEIKAYTFTTLYPNFLFPGKTQFVSDADSAQEVDAVRVLSSINPFSYIKTAKEINRFSPDILIIPYWMSFLAPALGTVARFVDKKIKIVSLVHNAISHEKTFFEKPLASYSLKKSDAYIVMSDLVKQDILTIKPNANILLKPHPIYDHYKDKIDMKEARKSLKFDPNKKTLLFFGFIRDYKGLDILIEATNYLTDDYQLIIAGESYGSFDKYTQMISNSLLKDNIIVFEQYINDDMVSLLFSAADVLVLPYKSATQSGVVAIAYQLEIPVIATNVGALGQAVNEAQTGLVVDEVDSKYLADTILDYFNNDRSDIFLKNIRSEKERLSWKSFAQSVEDFVNTKVL